MPDIQNKCNEINENIRIFLYFEVKRCLLEILKQLQCRLFCLPDGASRYKGKQYGQYKHFEYINILAKGVYEI